ncbi:MAG: serine acetyltransferase [Bacteroidales bacterium]|nr:serine acetyltransferase [Bacteroidales bacterium]
MSDNLQEQMMRTIQRTVDALQTDVRSLRPYGARGIELPMPNVKRLKQFVMLCRGIIFPGYFVTDAFIPQSERYLTGVNVEQASLILSSEIYAALCIYEEDSEKIDSHSLQVKAQGMAMKFVEGLPELRRMLNMDVEAIYDGDPAAESYREIVFAYPCIRALINYRVAHLLYKIGVPLIPRVITEMAHSETGIDIHPYATIGSRFAIDHGTGVVIGATAIIGNNVKIYQGVTLGAKSFPTDKDGNILKGEPRHPIIEDNVVIYAQATILGRVRIGEGSTIGGNVWVTQNVPPHSKIIQDNVKKDAQ